LVSSLAVARTREARYNSWDKNDPKDAQVILHLLKTGSTQRFLDPAVVGTLDRQEVFDGRLSVPRSRDSASRRAGSRAI
jgi:hypothetical protein